MDTMSTAFDISMFNLYLVYFNQYFFFFPVSLTYSNKNAFVHSSIA